METGDKLMEKEMVKQYIGFRDTSCAEDLIQPNNG